MALSASERRAWDIIRAIPKSFSTGADFRNVYPTVEVFEVQMRGVVLADPTLTEQDFLAGFLKWLRDRVPEILPPDTRRYYSRSDILAAIARLEAVRTSGAMFAPLPGVIQVVNPITGEIFPLALPAAGPVMPGIPFVGTQTPSSPSLAGFGVLAVVAVALLALGSFDAAAIRIKNEKNLI